MFAQYPCECSSEDQQNDDPHDDAGEFTPGRLGRGQLMFGPDVRAFIFVSRQGDLWSRLSGGIKRHPSVWLGRILATFRIHGHTVIFLASESA